MLFAFMFLSIGNALGMAWAYEELGWGGYWAWDPVENAACLPWFSAAAYVHSTMIQERRNMLKVWNVVLICITFFLTIFGTFLTRAGIISSVHAFAQSDIGKYFVGFMALVAATSAALIVWRLPRLRGRGGQSVVEPRQLGRHPPLQDDGEQRRPERPCDPLNRVDRARRTRDFLTGEPLIGDRHRRHDRRPEPQPDHEQRTRQRPVRAVRRDLRVRGRPGHRETDSGHDDEPRSDPVGERSRDRHRNRRSDALRNEQQAGPQGALAADDLEVER
jgi:hypothetical protein